MKSLVSTVGRNCGELSACCTKPRRVSMLLIVPRPGFAFGHSDSSCMSSVRSSSQTNATKRSSFISPLSQREA